MIRRPAGPQAWLVDEVAEPAAWSETLRSAGVPGIREIVPAEHTVLVVCDRARHGPIGDLLDSVGSHDAAPTPAHSVTIDVRYDGPDLPAVAELTGLRVGDIVDLHASGTYTVAFCGFSPGFAYLTGLDARLLVPRRATPRTVVPAGSVAIAAGYTSVYPSPSPGGWHLIGSTRAVLWDPAAARPALLVPATTVRFRQVGE